MSKDSEVWASRNKGGNTPKGTILKVKTDATKRRGKMQYKAK